jgi:hypothetical protein
MPTTSSHESNEPCLPLASGYPARAFFHHQKEISAMTTQATLTKQIQHTPGPWASCTASVHRPELVTAKNKNICSVWSGGSSSPIADGEWQANARLIAAAPELLEALEWQDMAEADRDAGLRKGYFDKARELRKAAIAKAKGGAA